jgi:hypothetical protein
MEFNPIQLEYNSIEYKYIIFNYNTISREISTHRTGHTLYKLNIPVLIS